MLNLSYVPGALGRKKMPVYIKAARKKKKELQKKKKKEKLVVICCHK